MARLDISMLYGIGQSLAKNHRAMFEDAFADGMRRGFTRSEMIRTITATFEKTAKMDLYQADRFLPKDGSLESYELMADLGFDLYVNGDMASEDAKALVDGNYDAFKQKSSAGAKSRSSSACRPKASKSVKASNQPRKKNGQFAKKPKSKGARR